MRFGDTPLDEAVGHILAHGQRLDDGTLKKGRILTRSDLDRLRAAGRESVVTACLDADDVHEDEAAGRLAEALAGPGMRARAPFTGRCNLFADVHGLFEVDAARIDALNRVHEALTLATLAAPSAVAPRQMLATVKIIPFAVPRAALDDALAAVRGEAPAMRMTPFRALRVGLVQTRLDGARESVLDKTTRVLSARLESLGSRLEHERRCVHSSPEVASTIEALLATGVDLVLVAGASAIVDRRDVVPAAMVRAGARVEHFGMPVDPGNLLLLARRGDVAMIGLPGCARSPKFNGLDMVLERICAGLEVGAEQVMGMGVGGLLKEIPERPQPRGDARTPARRPKVAALLLAAGQSRRMGAINKLLAEVDGAPMVRRVADVVAASGVDEIVVVTGHEGERVHAALDAAPVRFVDNPEYAQGLSTSLAAGIDALDESVDAILVCLGDMPRVNARDLGRLIAAFDPIEGRSICVPTHRGKRGNPVLFDRRYFDEMRAVRGDVGARHLIGEHEAAVCEVEMDDAGVLTDVDSPQALAALDRL